jgi:hypothetical protein
LQGARLSVRLQDAPDVVEVEVNAEGLWRPAGSSERWHSITEEPTAVAAALRAAGGRVAKIEPGTEGAVGGQTDPGGGDDPFAGMSSGDDSEEESEGAELRKAAAAYAARAKRCAGAASPGGRACSTVARVHGAAPLASTAILGGGWGTGAFTGMSILCTAAK